MWIYPMPRRPAVLLAKLSSAGLTQMAKVPVHKSELVQFYRLVVMVMSHESIFV